MDWTSAYAVGEVYLGIDLASGQHMGTSDVAG